jgi:hypothetical protein
LGRCHGRGIKGYLRNRAWLPPLCLAGQLHRQAEAFGQQARALPVLSAERAFGAGEADVVQRPTQGPAVLAHQPDPLAAGPGQLRSVVGGGFGYHVIKTKNTTFDVFGGGDFDQDFFGAIAATATTPAIPAVTRKNGEVDLGETFNAKINNRTTITEQFSLFPNVSSTGSYRFQFDTTAATKLKYWLSWQVTYSDRYLSDPLAGFKKNDLLLSTGVRLTFGKGVF